MAGAGVSALNGNRCCMCWGYEKLPGEPLAKGAYVSAMVTGEDDLSVDGATGLCAGPVGVCIDLGSVFRSEA